MMIRFFASFFLLLLSFLTSVIFAAMALILAPFEFLCVLESRVCGKLFNDPPLGYQWTLTPLLFEIAIGCFDWSSLLD